MSAETIEPATEAATTDGNDDVETSRSKSRGFFWAGLITVVIFYFFDREKGKERRRQLMTTLGIEDEKSARGL